MIQRLTIQNYAIIEDLEIVFSPGLTIITGETGAGKSILLGALGLIMGRRADTKALYRDDAKCVIEAFFEVSRYQLQEFFQENELDYEDVVVVRREILPSGKSRAFVNDCPVNLPILQELSDQLVDLHQQFDTLDIHSESFQLQMIDALASNHRRLAAYRLGFRELQADRRRLSELIAQREQAVREEEFLRFQLEELSKAELKPGEQSELEEELSRLSNAEEIKRNAGGVYQALNEAEPSAVDQLNDMLLSLGSLTKFHSGLASVHQRFQGIILELEDLAGELQSIAEDTEHDPERLLEVQGRLDLIYKLQNKHQVTSVEELLGIQESYEQQLGALGDASSQIEHLQEAIRQREAALRGQAEELREHRRRVIPGFEEEVVSRLQSLSMPYARLEVQLMDLDELNDTGLDELHFLFSANKGTNLQLIKDVASGGEMARLTLVTKSLVAGAIPLPTLIFDEIDTGVSGDVALKMGHILRKLSDEHQVISITHSPQIASKADDHYFVFKKVKDNRTVTKVRKLDEEERVRAVAVMLSSNPPSESALENARELIFG